MDSTKHTNLPCDPVDFDKAKVKVLHVPNPANFDAWTSLIAEIENTSPVDIEKICQVYDSFLSEFPLCYGYWKKYAVHKARLSTADMVVEVYERAVQSATYSVDLWLDYCSFGMLLFEDPVDVRRLFERGISFVGKDYRCYLLWDKYIQFEYSQKQWSSLAHIYIRALKFPTKKLCSYYDSFKKLSAIWEEEIEFQGNGATGIQSEATPNFETTNTIACGDAEISGVIRELLDPTVGLHGPNALQKYLSTGEQFYQKASLMDESIRCFESCIRRPYFHVKPLDVSQLENWHRYLDFVEMQGDFDWTVKLYERCLIPCANYPEFWMRYVDLVETKGGREIANFALARATQILLKRVPAVHLFCARFKEQIGDAFGTRAAFQQCDSEIDSDLIENIRREANMEKRLGNSEAAFNIYEKALEMAKEKQKLHVLSNLYVHFYRFKYMVTGSVDASREVLIKGIQHLPQCKLLLEELMNFEMMHRGPRQMNDIDSIVAHAISPGPNVSPSLSSKDREHISSLYLEFVDHCGTIQDIMKAWDRHRKLFPHLMRPASSNDYMEGRKDMIMALPHQASGDDNYRGSIQHLVLDQKTQLPESPNIEPDHAITSESLSEGIDRMKERLQLASPEVIEQSGQDANEQDVVTNDLVHEAASDCPISQNSPECSGEAYEIKKEQVNEPKKEPIKEPSNDMRPPSLENLSLNCLEDESRYSTPTTSYDCEVQETPESSGSRPKNHSYSNGNSSLSSLPCTQFGESAQAHAQTTIAPLHMETDPSSQQTQSHSQSQPLVPMSSPSNPSALSEGNWYQMNYSGQAPEDASSGFHGYPHTQPPQQWQISPQPQFQSSSMHSQMLMGQVYPCQPQPWQNPQVQPVNQAPNQYQVAASQVQPVNTHVWPAQNMQQQSFASASQPGSQPVPYPQGQVYPYPQQSNTQYVHMQNNQAYTPHMWHYYYQQQQQQPPQQDQQQPPQQQQQQQQLQQQQQQLQLHQQMTPSNIQTWNTSYYQQQAPIQHYGNSQYRQEPGQQAVGSLVQGTNQHNVEATGPAVYPYSQQHPPLN